MQLDLLIENQCIPSDFKNYILLKIHIMRDCGKEAWFCYSVTHARYV